MRAVTISLFDMLWLAEELFGPRDTSYTVHHVGTGNNIPQIIYFDNCPTVSGRCRLALR